MSRKHLLQEPQHVNGNQTWWYYEEASGLMIYRDAAGDPTYSSYVGTIPWARVRSALRRKDCTP